jgi:hypothetical protein
VTGIGPGSRAMQPYQPTEDAPPVWLFCPNTPRCPHPGLIHDIDDYDDPKPMCCVEGCGCGQNATAGDAVDGAAHGK